MIGKKISHYSVTAKLGEGGMGEVYRATDTKLNRDVAIKILPGVFAADPDRLARFQREALVLASLNHPNIAAIYGLEEGDGIHCLVLELVGGETLAERIKRGPLPLDEAFPIARQIAEGLEAAHERGVIHRDLKPDNVKISPDGTAKILDFGLAKALESDAQPAELSQSPTISELVSRTGVILGTAAYMSPEQARGRSLDRRTDIWSFGCVLYEMLTGKLAFGADTISDAIAGILQREPDWNFLPPHTPTPIRRLLQRCLDKDARRRLRDIGEARIALEEAVVHPRGAETQEAAPAANRRRLMLAAGLTAAVALAVGVLLGRFPTESPSLAPTAPLRAVLRLPEGTHLDGWASPVVAISPDGQKIAFVAEREGVQRLYIRHLSRTQAEEIANSEGAEGPFFSPDSLWVGFAAGNISGRASGRPELRKVSVKGGLPQVICTVSDYFGADWGDDGQIIFVNAQPQGLWRVAAAGGDPRPIAAPLQETEKTEARALFWPQILPGGSLAVVTYQAGPEAGRLGVVDLRSSEFKDLGLSGLYARYAPTGHLVYVTADAALMAVAFNPSRAQVAGSPVKIMEDLTISANLGAVFAFSPQGTLLYTTGYLKDSQRELSEIIRVDARGNIESLPVGQDNYAAASPSPDGQRVAMTTWLGDRVQIFDLRRRTRLALPPGEIYGKGAPIWTPDGSHVAYNASSADGTVSIYWQPVDGSGPPEPLTQAVGEQHPFSWTPDGKILLYMEFVGERGMDFDLWQIPVDGDRKPELLVGTPARELYPFLSPDGRWLAYQSDESGRPEVYVQPYPQLDRKLTISTRGGGPGVWSGDARELYYRETTQNKTRMMAVPISAEPEFRAGTPVPLFDLEGVRMLFPLQSRREFIGLRRVPGSGLQTEINLVLNWFDELRRLAPTDAK